MKAALIAPKEAASLPVICQMTYSEDGRTIPGTDPVTATILLDAMGADVIGANCSVGPDCRWRPPARWFPSPINL